MPWTGPFTVQQLLDDVLDKKLPNIPLSNAVYVITLKKWRVKPKREAFPIYVGSTTGKGERFKTRIGDLIADIFGFFGGPKAHHSGGKRIYQYCIDNDIHPSTLFIAWKAKCKCTRCRELHYYKTLRPTLSKRKPPACKLHFLRICKVLILNNMLDHQLPINARRVFFHELGHFVAQELNARMGFGEGCNQIQIFSLSRYSRRVYRWR